MPDDQSRSPDRRAPGGNLPGRGPQADEPVVRPVRQPHAPPQGPLLAGPLLLLPLGTDALVAKLETSLGRRLRAMPRGRPPKQFKNPDTPEDARQKEGTQP